MIVQFLLQVLPCSIAACSPVGGNVPLSQVDRTPTDGLVVTLYSQRYYY